MRKFDSLTAVSAGVMAAALLLSACGSSMSAENDAAGQTQKETAAAENPTPASDTSSAEEPADGSNADPTVVTIARGTDTVTLDPAFAGDNVDIWVDSLIFEGLVRASEDGTKIQPCLADTWDISEDGLTYTFHIRDGAKFSDGSDVTAQDAASNKSK